MSMEWKKKRMSSDLISAEDNRVADEDNTLAFLKETVMHTCSVILWCVASALLLECHLTYSAPSGYFAYASPAKCARVCVCVCTRYAAWNATRCSGWRSSTPSAQLHPSSLIIFAKSTINLMDLLCLWSLVMKTPQSKVISLKPDLSK